jgi:hypothetical protein
MREWVNWHLTHTLHMDATRSCTKAERALCKVLATEILDGRVSKHDIRLEASVIAGDIRGDKVTMGILELALNAACHPDNPTFIGRGRALGPVTRDRLQSVSVTLANHAAPDSLRKTLHAVRFRTTEPHRPISTIPQGLGSVSHEARLRSIFLALNDVYGEDRSE